MSELIDRQETVDRFNVIRPVDPKKDEYTKGIDVGIAMCIVAVKDQLTIQPEKTQLSQEGTTKDAISRRQALEKVRAMQTYKLFVNDDMLLVDKAEVQTELMMIPTIQPVATDTNVGDKISRQAAIDEIKAVYEWHDTVTIERLIEHINNLPSVQPEPQEYVDLMIMTEERHTLENMEDTE